MNLIERLERLGRLLLWLCLSAVIVMVPVGLHAQEKQAALVAERARADIEHARIDAEKEKAAAAPNRLALASMGQFLKSFSGSQGTAGLWFTNVSPRAGFVCVVGVATNRASQRTTRSLASCKDVAAYAEVHMQIMFAGAETNEMCTANSPCDVTIKDEPDASEQVKP